MGTLVSNGSYGGRLRTADSAMSNHPNRQAFFERVTAFNEKRYSGSQALLFVNVKGSHTGTTSRTWALRDIGKTLLSKRQRRPRISEGKLQNIEATVESCQWVYGEALDQTGIKDLGVRYQQKAEVRPSSGRRHSATETASGLLLYQRPEGNSPLRSRRSPRPSYSPQS
jgi:hypothetical protein